MAIYEQDTPDPGEYVVKYPTKPPTRDDIYAIDVDGPDFDAGSLANLSSGDHLRVVSDEPVTISYRGVPWYIAGTPGHPARPHDGSWPAVTVEVTTADGEKIQGRIPIDSFEWLTPVAPEASVAAEIG